MWKLFLIVHRNNCFVYVTLPQDTSASCQWSDSFQNTWTKHWFISVSPAGDGQIGCFWWEVAHSRFHVDLKSNFMLKTNSMEFLPGQITRWINVQYESRLKWTWHHSKLAVEEVSFFADSEWYSFIIRKTLRIGKLCAPVSDIIKRNLSRSAVYRQDIVVECYRLWQSVLSCQHSTIVLTSKISALGVRIEKRIKYASLGND